MAKQKSEGQQVREAFDGPSVDHDALIDQIEARARDEYARSSDAAESGAKVAAFMEETGMNSQAFSWLKAIVKKLPKKDGQSKAMDVIRTLKIGLPMIEAHVAGQGTSEMNLGEPDDDTAPDDEDDRDLDTEVDADTLIRDGDPELAAEAAEFEAQAKSTVTPINFGGDAA